MDAAQQGAAVNRVTRGVDHPTNPAVIGGNRVFTQQHHPIADHHAFDRSVRQDGDMGALELEDLSSHICAATAGDSDLIADAGAA